MYSKVSFIIPTLNAAWILPKCLNAIKKQNYPQDKVEIVIADGGSIDNTIHIAKEYGAIIVENPEVLHEPGKARASKRATGEILFFTDADNIIVGENWIKNMLRPYLIEKNVHGFLSQTEPPPDSSSFNRYLGYLFTDPLTWFIYGNAANPKDYEKIYVPFKKTPDYIIYKFTTGNHPLFGLSQGVGTTKMFKRGEKGWNDDILAGIKLIDEGKLIAYVPRAGVYHYHVKSISDFLKKYRWRIHNNLTQHVKGMGMINRERFLSKKRKIRKILFIPYSFSILFPLIHSLLLIRRYKNFVMLWHVPACLLLSILIIYEVSTFRFGLFQSAPRAYGK